MVPAAGPVHTLVVEAPPAAAGEPLAEETARLAACSVERRPGGVRIAFEYSEPGGRRLSQLSRILTAVERWLRRQPVAAVTVWVDGRRFALTRRDAFLGAAAHSQASARPGATALEAGRRPDQTVARTASS